AGRSSAGPVHRLDPAPGSASYRTDAYARARSGTYEVIASDAAKGAVVPRVGVTRGSPLRPAWWSPVLFGGLRAAGLRFGRTALTKPGGNCCSPVILESAVSPPRLSPAVAV